MSMVNGLKIYTESSVLDSNTCNRVGLNKWWPHLIFRSKGQKCKGQHVLITSLSISCTVQAVSSTCNEHLNFQVKQSKMPIYQYTKSNQSKDIGLTLHYIYMIQMYLPDQCLSTICLMVAGVKMLTLTSECMALLIWRSTIKHSPYLVNWYIPWNSNSLGKKYVLQINLVRFIFLIQWLQFCAWIWFKILWPKVYSTHQISCS